jgi:hypothetical protein
MSSNNGRKRERLQKKSLSDCMARWRGWNTPESHISVRFADTNEQRELGLVFVSLRYFPSVLSSVLFFLVKRKNVQILTMKKQMYRAGRLTREASRLPDSLSPKLHCLIFVARRSNLTLSSLPPLATSLSIRTAGFHSEHGSDFSLNYNAVNRQDTAESPLQVLVSSLTGVDYNRLPAAGSEYLNYQGSSQDGRISNAYQHLPYLQQDGSCV